MYRDTSSAFFSRTSPLLSSTNISVTLDSMWFSMRAIVVRTSFTTYSAIVGLRLTPPRRAHIRFDPCALYGSRR